VQVFGAAYGDYLRGNYQLAVEQFRQFLARFPLSEQADDAQYWIGESFFNQGLYDQALAEFDNLLSTYPQGDKVPAARLKRAYTLLTMNQTETGIKELRQLLIEFPDSAEATAAKQRLEQLGVPITEPSKSTRGRRTRKT
jgi:tol-pal system protein YbgF